ncbi:Cation-transporting ATPase [Geitlerinema sp. FC II]|nr:cation-transporting P-type ATPase [Geitlerinema sp. CS-897]PPT06779.1 Cation-transporting ATPase [Geitlerinema sp. FC II]
MSNAQPPSNSQQASLKPIADVLSELSVEGDRGLNASEIRKRQKRYGLNRLKETRGRSTWNIFLDQFKSPIIALLSVAAVLSFLFQEWIEGIAIIIAILLNASIGFFTEMQAVKSMESLKQLSKTKAKVRRDGDACEIAAEHLVPGDIILLEGGDIVSADLRVLEASKMQVDESALTGESVPVSKTAEVLDEETNIADRKNILFRGTALTRGSGEGVVVATGTNTELGRISELTASAEEEITPLEKRLDKLGRSLIWLTLAISALVAVAGIIGGKDLLLTIETAIALAVAAVPEGLPIVATVALARGMWRMAKRNALINRLSAVETLGATNIICTDKTGTLTENRMTVAQLVLESGTVEITGEGLSTDGRFRRDGEPYDPQEDETLRRLLEVGVLCNNAALAENPDTDESTAVGDPMEIALLVAGAKADLHQKSLVDRYPEIREVAFDSETKMMATIHESDDGYFVAVKGAPESVLSVCTQVATPEGIVAWEGDRRQTWNDRCTEMAKDGLRLLAFACKTVGDEEANPYENLTLLGVCGLLDPPRQDAKVAVGHCHDAGIRVIMVTGDQPITARNVGLAVGLTTERETEAKLGKELQPLEQLSDKDRDRLRQIPIFARVSPEQKLNLIALHQNNNDVVAMTGDGVNDAPALKKADIGVAMGKRGTQVACEAADMVLQDDAFATIIAAIEQGRAIFGNIRKFTIYLLSGNTGEIVAVAIAALINAPLPLLPLQILFLNAVNDVFPALALGVGEGSPHLMQQPPRDSQEPILAKRHWHSIASYGVLIGLTVLAVFWLCLGPLNWPQDLAVTVSFLSLAFGRLWHVFNMRDRNSPLFRNEIVQNPYVWGALLICTGLLLTSVYLPSLANVLQVVHPGVEGWGLILAASVLPLVIGQIAIELQKAGFQRWLKQRMGR